MPHNNYRIYSQGEYGIEPSDVSAVLGVGSSDIGTLCTSDKINMWAKYKPIQLNIDDINPYSRSNWWKGDDPTYPCGIKSKVFPVSELQEIEKYFTKDLLHGWERQTVEPPFRIADFNGYNHVANPPFKGLKINNTANWGGSIQVIFDRSLQTEGEDKVTFEMISGKKYVHPAFAIKNLTEPFAVFNMSQNMDSFGVTDGNTYIIYPLFYATDDAEKSEHYLTERFYTCVGVPPIAHTVEARLRLRGRAIQSSDVLQVNLYIENLSDEEITISNNYVMTRLSDDFNPATISGKEQIWVDNTTVTIKPNSSATLWYNGIGVFPNIPIKDIHLLVNLDGAKKRQRISIITENVLTDNIYNDNVIEQ